MHAIWLTFSKNDRNYLKNIIDKIAESYHGPKFEPHITIYGLINSELSSIDNAVKQIAVNYNTFSVNKLEILYSEELWKTVYIEIKMNDNLDLINKNLRNHFEKILNYYFSPHISLIYKIMPREEKIKIINELDIKNEFTISKIAVQKFLPDIKRWQIVKEYNLN